MKSKKFTESFASTATVLILVLGITLTLFLAAAPRSAFSAVTATAGPLRVSATNPRYFADATGKVVYLAGSHNWSNFQDTGAPPIVFDYTAYLDFLTSRNLNFFRQWTWEQARWGSWTASNIDFTPLPYLRTGPGNALDGKPRFDLSQFNEEYFTRLRQRIIQARDRGIYVSVMLFDGWSIEDKQSGGQNPWRGHPFNAANNINGINGDPNGDGGGGETHTLLPSVSAVTAIQQAYVRKVIDTVNDLDNVLYEISNESHMDSTAWQYAMIDYIKSYEQSKPFQHPVGMTVQWPNGNNTLLMQSRADWVAPNATGGYMDNPPDNAGAKVIVGDTDHLWGIGGDVPWVWKSFTRGINTLFMDPYDCSPFWPPAGCNTSVYEPLRLNLGYARSYAERMNLAVATPRGDLCSTTFCLANVTAPGAEFLVYQPAANTAFTVNLAGLTGSFSAEWLNPANGSRVAGSAASGGAVRSFTPPFSGNAVLYLKQTDTANPTATATATSTATALPTATATALPTPTFTRTPAPTATPTTAPTSTPTSLPTNTPVPTATQPPAPTATLAATATATSTSAPAATATATATTAATAAATATTAPTATTVATAAPTATPRAQFPTSALLDNFNRANAGMGANWMYQPGSYGVVSRSLRAPVSGLAVWKPATFGSNQEAFVRLTSVAATARETGVLLKMTFNNNQLVTGLAVGYLPATGRVRVSLLSAKGAQPLTPETPAVFAAGDVLGARARSDGVVEFFRNGALLGSLNAGAALAPAGGRIGLYVDYGSSGNTVLDDFGGGNAGVVTGSGYQLQVNATAIGSGAVQVEPAGAVVCGQPVTMVAAAAPGWQFGGWTGDIVENRNPLTYPLDGSLTVAAQFIEEGAPRVFNVSVQRSGEGAVDVQPAGPYAAGQVVGLAARPSPGWIFTGWTGAQPEANNPVFVQVAGDVALTANFAPATNVYLPAIQQAADAVAAATCE